MKNRITRIMAAALTVLTLLIQPVLAAGSPVYTNTRQLADNLQYINTISWSGTTGREESFALRLTGLGDAYPIVMKNDTIYGTFKISQMVSYAESLGLNVLAAVNSDFFSMQTGVPLGIVIEDGIYKSSPSGRTAVCFDYNGGAFLSEAPAVTITLLNNGNGGNYDIDNTGKTVSLNNFNKFRMNTGGLYLFSEAFSTVSTRTNSPGWYVKFRILDGTPSVSGMMTLEVTETLISEYPLDIGEGYMVLSAADESGFIGEYEKFAVGDIVTLTTECNDLNLINAQYATGGGDILINGGVMTDPAGWDSSILTRAPRTAFGVLADGTVISYVVDGRNSEHSVGLTLTELAEEMLRQGCVYAVNFDGGGSSALSVRLPGAKSASVVSKPSDGTERGCATYILFVTDMLPNGRAENLSIVNDGEIILAGSQTEFLYTATDSSYKPAAAPTDITAVPSTPGSSVQGTLYTAGDIAGTDLISLYSPLTGVSGTGSFYVITRPTSITATKRGSSTKLTSVKLMAGDTLELDVTATYYRRNVTAQLNSFTFEVTGDIGEFTDTGVFTAGQLPLQKGTITISAGSTTTVIQVELGGFTDMNGHWAREYVDSLASGGVVKGVTDTEYGPELEIKRGDFLLMLYRAAGEPSVSVSDGFTDVPGDAYYAQAILWGMETGIAQGTGDGKFEPQASLTRQQAFTFVYRTLGILGVGYEDGTTADLAEFTDYTKVAKYAITPTATLINLGVVGGADGKLTPEAPLTRAQMAKVLAVVLELQGLPYGLPVTEEQPIEEQPVEELPDEEPPDEEPPVEEPPVEELPETPQIPVGDGVLDVPVS